MAETQQIEELVVQLGEHGTRARARRLLRQHGAAAAEALMAVLQQPNALENTRWAAVTLLAACKHEPAVPLLVGIMESDPNLRGEAARALQAITGKDIGEDPALWRSATQEGEAGAASAPAPVAAADGADRPAGVAVFEKALAGVASEMAWEESGYLYIRVPLDEGRRKQQMIVTFEENALGQHMTTVYTECGPASRETVDVISRRNVTLRYGEFVVEDDEEEGKKVVMRFMIPTRELTGDLARHVVLNMAREADSLEFELTGSDHI